MAFGLVAAVAGKGALGIALLAAGAIGAAVGAVADGRIKIVEERNQNLVEAADRERSVQAALRTPVCKVVDARIEAIGVDAVDPRVLGQALKTEGDQLSYVRRDVDMPLRGHLAQARDGHGPALVCLHGPSKAGKSRSMLEAIKAELPDAVFVVPERTRENLQTIIDLDVLQRANSSGEGVVLWLDDLEGYVRLGDKGLDWSTVSSLKLEIPTLVVAATAGGRGVIAIHEYEASQLHEPISHLLAHAATEELLPGLTSKAERAALAAIAPPKLVKQMRHGLGAVAVSGAQLVRILVSGSHPRVQAGQPCDEGAAVVWAAVCAYRLGLTEPLDDGLLRKLFGCFKAMPTDATYEMAVRWATKPLYGEVALLRAHGNAYVPYDYVVQHAPHRADDAQRCLWTELLNSGSPLTLAHLASKAYLRGAMDDAFEASRRADDADEPFGSVILGEVLRVRGDLEGAEAAFRRCGERALHLGALGLGNVLEKRGDLDGALEAFERARRSEDEEIATSAGNRWVGILAQKELDRRDREIEKLADLLDRGILTTEEYEAQKQAVIDPGTRPNSG